MSSATAYSGRKNLVENRILDPQWFRDPLTAPEYRAKYNRRSHRLEKFPYIPLFKGGLRRLGSLKFSFLPWYQQFSPIVPEAGRKGGQATAALLGGRR